MMASSYTPQAFSLHFRARSDAGSRYRARIRWRLKGGAMFISTIMLALIMGLTVREWRRHTFSARNASAILMTALSVVGAVFWFLTFKHHGF
jgi:hypothetical protein